VAKQWIGPLLNLFGTNWITLFGANLTTVSAIAIIGFFLLGLLGLADSPYIALMALLVLPGVFVFGLLLIPVGMWVQRRKLRARGAQELREERPYPVIDFNKVQVRRIGTAVGSLTVANILLISIVSYEGVLYMDSTEFCGEVCHTVMQPEYATFQDSPHSRVGCVECHIGPGAPWFVRSKLSGLGQVVAVSLNTYPTPIPSPVHDLRPSTDICENCHWPERFAGDRVRVITRFSEDEANTPLKTVLLMHIGGGGREEGIHSWHINPGRETFYYSADERRERIPWVQVREGDEVVEFVADGFDLDRAEVERGKRLMDCIDCHNRPTHIFRLPAEAMDLALENRRIDRDIPFIKRVGVETLQSVGDTLGPSDEVARRLREFYETAHAEFYAANREKVDRSIRGVQDIYERNVFPDMRLTWGYHPNHIGHEWFDGCFRCHDGSLSTADGQVIDQDCGICHTLLAWDERDPDILRQLQID
jgi:hypothetical protein